MKDFQIEPMTHAPPEASPPARPAAVGVLHDDEHVLVVNKPPGVVLRAASDDEPDIANLLRKASPPLSLNPPVAAYPLDAEVSGALVLPRHAKAIEWFEALFAEDRIEIECLAIVSGFVDGDSGAIEMPISHDRRDGHPFRDPQNGVPTRTEWRLRDRFIGHALIECRPRPPVPRYLRMHLQSVDWPLAVDPQYGGATHLMLSSFKAGYRPSRRRDERPLIRRVSLHVAAVAFPHPATGATMRIEAPLAKDMRATIHQLERFGRIPR